VPTPALVVPIEFTMHLDHYAALGGHMGSVVRVEDVIGGTGWRSEDWQAGNPWPLVP
jgi:hypothetical protein